MPAGNWRNDIPEEVLWEMGAISGVQKIGPMPLLLTERPKPIMRYSPDLSC